LEGDLGVALRLFETGLELLDFGFDEVEVLGGGGGGRKRRAMED
jgi:hypothetical protein